MVWCLYLTSLVTGQFKYVCGIREMWGEGD
jgi:hypothetical protein